MSTATQPSSPPSKGKIFFRRLFSSIVLWTIVISALFSSNAAADYVFLLIMVLLAGLGLAEFYGMVEKREFFCFPRWGIAAGLLLMIFTFLHLSGRLGIHDSPARVNDFEVIFLIIFVLGLCLRQFVSQSSTSAILAISTTLFGLMYVPWLLNFIQKINFFRGIDGNGNYYVLYFILVTKFSDLGAYCVGSLIGRHKMIPRISPGKTWEGFGGAIVVSTLVSLTFAHFAGNKLFGMTPLHAVLSCSAVVGDLIESIFKREAGVKDSGKFFPGIGGILDLLDSLLFNAPLMYLYLRHVLTR